MNKSQLELAVDLVVSMNSRGQINIPKKTGEPAEDYNLRAIHYIGFCVEEMYREMLSVPTKAKSRPSPNDKKNQQKRIVIAK